MEESRLSHSDQEKEGEGEPKKEERKEGRKS